MLERAIRWTQQAFPVERTFSSPMRLGSSKALPGYALTQVRVW